MVKGGARGGNLAEGGEQLLHSGGGGEDVGAEAFVAGICEFKELGGPTNGGQR